MYHVSASPHVHGPESTKGIMTDVLIAMLPATIYGVWQFGISAAIVIVLTIAAAIAAEYLYEKGMKKPITISDMSAAVTGLIIALNMPPEIPVWMPILGSIFAIVVIKQLYGGLGQNWMNPALGARCFLLLSFTKPMADFTSKTLGFDAVSSSTPLAAMKADATSSASTAVEGVVSFAKDSLTSSSLLDLVIGRIPGTIGEVSVICLLIGAIYLLYRRVITITIPLTYIVTFAIFMFIFGAQDPLYVACQVCAGGLIFGAFFMATDYVTSPITPKGQIVFGICLGLLTGIFRVFGSGAEGVSYAIILCNILTPLIERATVPVAFGKKKGASDKK